MSQLAQIRLHCPMCDRILARVNGNGRIPIMLSGSVATRVRPGTAGIAHGKDVVRYFSCRCRGRGGAVRSYATTEAALFEKVIEARRKGIRDIRLDAQGDQHKLVPRGEVN
jgi:hypothetical protein